MFFKDKSTNSKESMVWDKLLSIKRLGREEKPSNQSHFRSEWQKDFDRIIFSTAFRRLQDKTQVFPLTESDYPRTRLTHSLESAVVGRSLGIEVGNHIINTYDLNNIIDPFDFGSIVASACLAHDIGNPPFGHSGEDAIQDWFNGQEGHRFLKHLDQKEQKDFLNFEGNAQGFRILTKLQRPKQEGGMQLTYTTLAAYTKYPRESLKNNFKKLTGVSSKKHGFFQSDGEIFKKIAKELQLKIKTNNSIWCRHPLAFLVEAADDVCYRIIDLEDGFLLKYINFESVLEHLTPLLEPKSEIIDNKKISPFEKVEYLRGKALNNLIKNIVKAFIDNEKDILSGEFDEPLVDQIIEKESLEKLNNFNRRNIYKVKDVVAIEMSGFEVLQRLLNLFVPAAFDLIQNGNGSCAKSKKVAEYVFGYKDFDSLKGRSQYEALLKVTDFISGMSDSYAVSTFRQIAGLSLPNR